MQSLRSSQSVPVSGIIPSQVAMKAANAAAPLDGEAALAELHRRQNEHPFWQCRLLRAFAAGQLTKDDLRYVFGEYYRYSKSFTRYIAALMARCENDYFRSRLSENLWDEGGGADPERRHAQIFRRFLSEALGIDDPDSIKGEGFTRHFVSEYLTACMDPDPTVGAAFLSLGTEGIVGRLYGVMVEGMRRAGIEDSMLSFFFIHMEVDDEHAVTLEELMTSYSAQPGWFDTCARAMDKALQLRMWFFDQLYEGIRHRRVQGYLDKIQDRRSLTPDGDEDGSLVFHAGEPLTVLYENEIERLDVSFMVLNLPFKGETLDPRVVRIAPRKCNEKHKHAHETFYYVLQGRGRISIDGHVLKVKAGDMAFVPRWSLHQTVNDSDVPMIVLAITDANITDKAFVGKHSPRMKTAQPG